MDWRRIASVVPNATLFGDKAVTPTDVVNGSIGNCWFMSAVAGLAEHEGKVEKLFLNSGNGQSRNGIYGVNMYTMGIPHTILVDDYVPVSDAGNGQHYTIYQDIDETIGVWGPLLEKALAKRFGNYEHIVGGLPSRATRMLTGAPYEEFVHHNSNANTIWQLVASHNGVDDFITGGTEGNEDRFNMKAFQYGLESSSAYTIIGAYEK